jgi:hypothetical protein
MNNAEICRDDTKRRREIRNSEGKRYLNGIDYVQVEGEDQTILRIFFLLKAPKQEIEPGNIRIDGGRRIRNMRAMSISKCRTHDKDLDDCMQITVDKAGDFSTYTLCLVEMDHNKQPTDIPLKGFDRRYYCVDFSFKASCPSDLDCMVEDICPPKALVEPAINYLAKDYASFRQLILDRLSLIMPGWQERHVPDIGMALVEILAYVGDYLSYYQDAVAAEAYLGTARQRISVRRHACLVDYQMHEGCNARTWLFVETSDDVSLSLDPQDTYFITGFNEALTVNSTMLSDVEVQNLPSSDYEVFEALLLPEGTNKQILLYKAHNEISFYTWDGQECCLPRGATRATLKDTVFEYVSGQSEQAPQQQQQMSEAPPASTSVARSSRTRRRTKKGSTKQEPPKQEETSSAAQQTLKSVRGLNLVVGDILIFEEVKGPTSGVPADADPTHRHAVRLTKVEQNEDILYDPPIPALEIEWAAEDALPFPLCLSAIGPAPECQLITDISVARGNIILVDHGKTIKGEDLGSVQSEQTICLCLGEGDPGDTEYIAEKFSPHLQKGPLTFSQPLPDDAPFFHPEVPDPSKPVSVTSAQALLIQEPRQALPCINLKSTPEKLKRTPFYATYVYTLDEVEEQQVKTTDLDYGIDWTVQRDLLASQEDQFHHVVEMDNDGIAHLRFGDGTLGYMPDANMSFNATYRIGNGIAGNVGADAISHIVFGRTQLFGVTLRPRNPFAVLDGTDPESIAEVKLFAPHAFHIDMQRAITADDYARLAADSNPRVQRAAATLNWTGNGYSVLVAIDPSGSEEADDELLQEIAAKLERYRRIGHDLQVVSAQYVSLHIAMSVCVKPNYLSGHVKAALLEVFSNRELPGGRKGFFHPDNQTFGTGIALSKLVAVAQAVPGVLNVEVTSFERQYEEPNGEIDNEFLPLGSMEIARLDNDPSFPENGVLELKMEGGR